MKEAHINKVSLAAGIRQWGWAGHQCLGCRGSVYAVLMGWSCSCCLIPEKTGLESFTSWVRFHGK